MKEMNLPYIAVCLGIIITLVLCPSCVFASSNSRMHVSFYLMTDTLNCFPSVLGFFFLLLLYAHVRATVYSLDATS